jgi:hypothetical protein
MMTGNAMSLLLLVAEWFNGGLTFQQEEGTHVRSVSIVILNVGVRMMKASAIQNAQHIGSVFLQEIDTRAQLQLTDP